MRNYNDLISRSLPGYCVTTNKFCYIPILKCASYSMMLALQKMSGAQDNNFLTNPKALDLCVITLLRDPVARFISAYNYVMDNHDMFKTKVGPLQMLNMTKTRQYTNGHFIKQAEVLSGIEPDIVGRVEQISIFEQKVGVELPRCHEQKRDYFSNYENADLLRNIEAHYADDYLLLEKHFGNCSSK